MAANCLPTSDPVAQTRFEAWSQTMASDCAKRTSSRWRRSLANDEPLHRRRPAFTEGRRSGSQ